MDCGAIEGGNLKLPQPPITKSLKNTDSSSPVYHSRLPSSIFDFSDAMAQIMMPKTALATTSATE